jgi:hypothetical protein
MNWLSSFAAWGLCKLDHIPVLGVALGEANWAFKILAALLLAGTFFWAKRKWGTKQEINPDAGVFTKVGITVHNWRASIVGTFAMIGVIIIIGSAFATGMLGYGNMLNLQNGPSVLPCNNYWVDYVRDITFEGQPGKKMLLNQPNGPGAWDTEHPVLAFVPNSSIPANVKIEEGGIISLSLFQNRYTIGEAVPDADPNFKRASL